MRALLLAAIVTGCGGAGGSGASVAAPPPGVDPFAADPLAAFATLEDRLLHAARVEVAVAVSASGAAQAELTGTIVVEPQLEASIVIDGSFDGNEIEARWASSAAAAIDTPAPTWAEGILLGLTRMGVLHNWARLVAGADPDTGLGDVLEATDLAWKDGAPATRTLTFQIVFDGAPVGDVELTLDEAGLPRHRAQLVHFPDGDMRVVEAYTAFQVR